ncbi:MAG: leucine dehydrogenase, partial [Actinomycetota bacterium]|nr:leucine dehydrogenase [Actinomycetota bacterium]
REPLLLYEHEQVTYFADPAVGLRAIVAIHSTVLGPALGGVRFWHYAREQDARTDALRLSQAMTMKAAVADLPQGGGKAVVFWDDPHAARSDAFLRSLGRWIDVLGGRYLAAEDVGASQRDMDGIARETPWVTGVDPARGGSGDPSPVTAFGVLHGMRAACEAAFGSGELAGRRVVVQGAGHVGACLARLLVDAGAHVAIGDIDDPKARAVGVPVLASGEVMSADCDVFAPCALGGVLTRASVVDLRCAVVCGAANNQLLDDDAGEALEARGIVYAPDYVVNAGGIINIAQEWAPGGYAADRAYAEVARIAATTRHVFAIAREEHITSARAADELARRRIAAVRRGPYRPGEPSAMRDALVARHELFKD